MKRSDPVDFSPRSACGEPPLAPELAALSKLQVYPRSQVSDRGVLFFLARVDGERRLGLLAASADCPLLADFSGEHEDCGKGRLLLAPLSHENALALRSALTWLRPQPLGLRTSAGCGDRLGVATPGHVRAAALLTRRVGPAAPGMIFAQQSIREMTRTGRSPDNVMDDATWGLFQEGWQAPIGADADHLKSTADIDRCVAAGFTFYTIDPGDHVDGEADTGAEATLRAKFAALPWQDLDSSPADLLAAYAGRRYDLATGALVLDEQTIVRAAVKYSRAIAHTARMYRHLAGQLVPEAFELEVSVDETDTPTSHAEHVFVASELYRVGVRWVSLAPRFVGRFEKGVDYIPSTGERTGGDLSAIDRDIAGHAAIAQYLGPYKLSLHSGSDKFSIYGIAAHHARGLLHLKTAGTSYVEALRAIAGFDPTFFRELYGFAVERYETDRASYHVSAKLSLVPAIGDLPDSALPGLLDHFDVRQVLHVTFGSVLNSDRGYRTRLLNDLREHEEDYYAILERHFLRHLEPLANLHQ